MKLCRVDPYYVGAGVDRNKPKRRQMTRIRSIPTILLLWLATVVTAVVVVTSDDTVTDVIDLDQLIDDDLARSPPPNGDTVNNDDVSTAINDDALDEVEKFIISSPVNNAISDETIKDSSKPEIVVKSNLESMSDEELMAICAQRGFYISVEGEEGTLTHSDYVAAATECLSLEKETNAILAENPDLAAELEDEIERMRIEKKRLELERDTMLAETAVLEDKLRLAGVDPKSVATVPTISQNSNSTIASVDEVLRESFVTLFNRVGADLQMVGGVLCYVLKPVRGSISLVWRYTSPTIEGFIRQLLALSDSVVGTHRLDAFHQTVLMQCRIVTKLISPFVVPAVAATKPILRLLYRRQEIQNVVRILGAFFGPLSESLLSGWKMIEPDIVSAVTNTTTWWRRLNDEKVSQANVLL
jgi:hypothetical protein